MMEELWLEPVSWLLGENDFSYHGLQSPSQGEGSFLEGQAEKPRDVPWLGGRLPMQQRHT